MDHKTARWAKIVFLYPDQVVALHQREIWLGTRCGPLSTPRFIEKGLATWQATDLMEQGIRAVFPDGYWPKSMDASEQAASIDVFERSIFPVWMGILKKEVESELAAAHGQAATDGTVMTEILTTHKQDVAIIAAGVKPNRMGHDQERLMELRQKAVRARGDREPYGKDRAAQ